MSSIVEAISAAIQHHQAGRLDEAEQIYRQILATEPRHADALHLLGVIASQRGQYAAAVATIQRAIETNPRDAGYYINYGNALMALGKVDEAIGAFSAAVGLNADFAEAHVSLGNAWRAKGALRGAIEAYRRGLELKPDFAEALSNLGATLKADGRLPEAVECYERAVKLRPNLAEAHSNLGNALFEQGHLEEAVASFRKALAAKSDVAAVHNNLGNALLQLNRIDEAVACFTRALELDPNYANAYSNLGMAYKANYLLDEAVNCYRRALSLAPDMAAMYNNLGNALSAQGEFNEAMASYDRALVLDPQHADAHFSRAFLLLQHGEWQKGWQEYEWRWKTRDLQSQALSRPAWTGQPLGRMLLHTDQGAGDSLQFIRFAKLLKERVNRVVLRCPTRLIPLLKSCPGIDEIVSAELPPPPSDAEAYLTSLPGPLGITLDNLPCETPYLHADERLVDQWQKKLPTSGFKVGIAWQGNPIFKNDRTRSIPLAEFAPLAGVKDVKLISLQKGFGVEQMAAIKDQFELIDLGPSVDDQAGAFMDTAAVMMNLDLVITSDTSIAHLAGALGVPVWVALSRVPEWRWLLDRSDSPWYPTMRLFRQRNAGDWTDVFEKIKAALMVKLGPK